MRRVVGGCALGGRLGRGWREVSGARERGSAGARASRRYFLCFINLRMSWYGFGSISFVLSYSIESLPRKLRCKWFSPASKTTCSTRSEQQPTVSASSAVSFSPPTRNARRSIRYTATDLPSEGQQPARSERGPPSALWTSRGGTAAPRHASATHARGDGSTRRAAHATGDARARGATHATGDSSTRRGALLLCLAVTRGHALRVVAADLANVLLELAGLLILGLVGHALPA